MKYTMGACLVDGERWKRFEIGKQTAAVPCLIEGIPRRPLSSPVVSTSNALSISNGDRPSPIASALTLPRAVTVNTTVPPESNATVQNGLWGGLKERTGQVSSLPSLSDESLEFDFARQRHLSVQDI